MAAMVFFLPRQEVNLPAVVKLYFTDMSNNTQTSKFSSLGAKEKQYTQFYMYAFLGWCVFYGFGWIFTIPSFFRQVYSQTNASIIQDIENNRVQTLFLRADQAEQLKKELYQCRHDVKGYAKLQSSEKESTLEKRWYQVTQTPLDTLSDLETVQLEFERKEDPMDHLTEFEHELVENPLASPIPSSDDEEDKPIDEIIGDMMMDTPNPMDDVEMASEFD
eukprot:CAMPEP_0117420054 /NCGR_PEP_ID=MMETSP0758-20121206/1477_1 /TAXON_ID=63605 /ORGANISM="Percolomonas cosmopolitus, Strain AE-1 (ATCC 50343)" /LENGTH=218 /DNA_ID=CAMNT_0005201457 /DNA_START=655 /DNA_END=1308 /DNA_ORIENTATION=-